MATRTNRQPQPAQRPEKKIGPFHGGLAVAIWLNNVETENGPRFFRSVTLAPRRYRDAKTGEWKDAKSYRPVDLSTLILAMEACASVLCGCPVARAGNRRRRVPGHARAGRRRDYRNTGHRNVNRPFRSQAKRPPHRAGGSFSVRPHSLACAAKWRLFSHPSDPSSPRLVQRHREPPCRRSRRTWRRTQHPRLFADDH